MPKVSVIVPVYGVEPYIADSAAALLGQRFEDAEFIFIDDCTPDRSMEVLEAVLADFPQRAGAVVRYRMPVNSGQAAVRLKGLELATGDYVIFCDSDDRPHPDALRLLYERAAAEDLDMVSCDFRRGSDEEGWETVRQHYTPGKELSSLLLGTGRWSLCIRLVRRQLYTGLMAPAGDMGEDMVLCLQAVARARRCAHIPLVLYDYCRRPGSISERADRESCIARWRSVKANTDRMLDFLYASARYRPDDPEIIAFKYHVRRYLEPLLGEREGRRLWKNTYPEIDRRLLFTRGIPLKRKLLYLAKRSGLWRLRRATRR